MIFGGGVGADPAAIEVVEAGGAPLVEPPLGARAGRATDAADEYQGDQASQGKAKQASGQPLLRPLVPPLASLRWKAPRAGRVLATGALQAGWELHGELGGGPNLGACPGPAWGPDCVHLASVPGIRSSP